MEEALYKHSSGDGSGGRGPFRTSDWGETVCAFVTLKPDADGVSDQDIMDWCREQVARFKVPRTVVFGSLPKTSTGKIQKFKFVLREQAKAL